MSKQEHKCDYVKDLEHENACLKGAYDEMRTYSFAPESFLIVDRCLSTTRSALKLQA